MPIAICDRCDKYYLTTPGDLRHRRCPGCSRRLRVTTREAVLAHLRRPKEHPGARDSPFR
jgi:hypothetical protein